MDGRKCGPVEKNGGKCERFDGSNRNDNGTPVMIQIMSCNSSNVLDCLSRCAATAEPCRNGSGGGGVNGTLRSQKGTNIFIEGDTETFWRLETHLPQNT